MRAPRRQVLFGFKLLCGLLGIILCHSPPAQAAMIYTGGTDSAHQAAASFDIVGGNLVVTLTNTSTQVFTGTNGDSALVPNDILTGLFFSLAGNPALMPISATASAVVNAQTTAQLGPNVGGEWAYLNSPNLTGAPGGANQGIGSSGYAGFGQPNFNGPDLAPPVAVDGFNYGIVGSGYTAGSGVDGIPTTPLIQNSATFVLDSLPNGFSLAAISNVSFQYGTDLSETNVPGTSGVPVPPTFTLALFGLATFGVVRLTRLTRRPVVA